MAFTVQKRPASKPRSGTTAATPKSQRAAAPGQPRFLRDASKQEAETGESAWQAEPELDADTQALSPFLRVAGQGGQLENDPKPTDGARAGRAFGGEDDGSDDPGDDAPDDDTGGVDDFADAADGGGAGAPAAGGEGSDGDKAEADQSGTHGSALGAPGGGGSGTQFMPAERGKPSEVALPVQEKCASCGRSQAQPQASVSPVQRKCSACGQPSDPPQTLVQQKCSTCSASSSASGQPRDRVQHASDARVGGGSTGVFAGPVQMVWNCREHSKPSCSRDPTPLSTLVQTKCDEAEPEPQPLTDEQSERAMAVHREAAQGLRGANQRLPYWARIQAAFGRHDVSGIRVNVGGEARVAATNMGSLAFTSGERIAFREPPGLHLVAHEAAHSVQQRAGIHLTHGVGTPGDYWEQHADRVADAVVQGRSAEPLLDEVAGAVVQPSSSVTDAATKPSEATPERATNDAGQSLGRDANERSLGTLNANGDAATGSSHEVNSGTPAGAVQQQPITTGATPRIARPAVRVPRPPPLAGAAQAPQPEGAAGGGGAQSGSAPGAGSEQGSGAPESSDPAANCAEAQGESEADPAPDPQAARREQIARDPGSVGANDCYTGNVDREPPPDLPQPEQDAQPNEVEKDNATLFPAWTPPDDVCDCAEIERTSQQDQSQSEGQAAAGGGSNQANPCTTDSGGANTAEGTAGGPAAGAASGAVAGAAAGAVAGAAGGPAAGSGGGGGGGESKREAKTNPEAVTRERARDVSVEKYTAAANSLSRRSFGARKLPAGIRFAGAKRGSASAAVSEEAAVVRIRGLATRASKQMTRAIRFGEREVPTTLGSKADAAKSVIESAVVEKQEAVKNRVAAAHAKAAAQAAGAKGHVLATHLASVVSATARTATAIKSLSDAHAEATKSVTARREAGLSGLNDLFSAYRILHNLAGETAADGAIAEGNRRAGVYERCKKGYKADGLFVGCLTVRQAHAQQKAACETSKATADNMVTTAMRQGYGLRALRTQFRCAIISGAKQAQSGIDELRDQLTQALNDSLQSTIGSLDATRDAKLHEIDVALATQQQTLNDHEHTQLQAISDSGYIQQVAAEEQAHAGAEGLAAGIAAALETTENTVSKFIDKLTAGEPPPAENLDEALKSGDEGLATGLGKLMARMHTGLGDASESLDKTGNASFQALGRIADNSDDETTSLEQSFTQSMGTTQDAATRELGGIRDAQVTRAAEFESSGVCGVNAAATGFSDAVTGITGKALEALQKSLTELKEKDLDKQQTELGDKITRNAWLAADKEQPAWVDVVAIVLIIVVIALSIAASILTAGAFTGVAALIVGALVGAVVGAISAGLITILSNWRAGERDVFQGVGQAMAIGAAGGLIGGLAGGVGGLAAGAAARGVASAGARLAINVSINMVADLVGEAATQAFACQVFGQEFNLSGFITAAVTSGISSARGPRPSMRAPTPRGPRAPRAPRAPRPPRPGVGETLRGVRPRGSDLAAGALGLVAAEGGAYVDARLRDREYQFDAVRAASNFAGTTGASSAARHSAAGDVTSTRQHGIDGGEPGAAPVRSADSGGDGSTPVDTGAPRLDAPDADTGAPRAAGTDEGGPGAPRAASEPETTSGALPAPQPTRGAVDGAPPRAATEPATPPRALPEEGSGAPRTGDAAEAGGGPRTRADEASVDADGAPRLNDTDADLVAPGASRPVELGEGSHTVAAKRTASGEAVITLCSTCSRMATRLDELAAGLDTSHPARAKVEDLAAEVRALESRITNKDIPDADIPAAVAQIATKAQAVGTEHPSTAGRLAQPDLDPAIVRARERARVRDPEGFAQVEGVLGQKVPPLPAQLEANYRIDTKKGVIYRRSRQRGIQLRNVDGRIEVPQRAPRPETTLDAGYVRRGLSEADAAEMQRIRDKSKTTRTTEEQATLRRLRRESEVVDLNAGEGGVGASLRPLSEAETTELRGLRENEARTPAETQRLESLDRRAKAADELETRGDSSLTQSQRNDATERLGHLASDEFIAQAYPGSTKVYEGTGGPGQPDVVYRNGNPPPTFIVVEAKGGSARNTSSRRVGDEQVQQGRRDYLESVLNDGRTTSRMDADVLDDLHLALRTGDLAYLEVTQPVNKGGGLGDIRAREYAIGGPNQSNAGLGRGGPNAAGGGDGNPTVSRQGNEPPRGPEGPETPSREQAATRVQDNDTQLVTPGASHPVGEGHTLGAKRTPNGDVSITVCSACSRMSSRLNALAEATPNARARLQELANEVIALERRIQNGEIDLADVPEAVAALAGRISATAAGLPDGVARALTGGDFDPDTVRVRELARISQPEAFARIEQALGAEAVPLPAALRGLYELVDGRLVAVDSDAVPLSIVNGRIEVRERGGQPQRVDTGEAELARIRQGEPGRIRPEAELNDADVARSLNDQLAPIRVEDVDAVIARFPPEQQAQARTVLAEASGFGNLESLNALRQAMDQLAPGRELYLPGSGSLADNLAYLSSKAVYEGVSGVTRPLTTTQDLLPRAVVILDDVVLHRIQTDAAFARSLVDNACVLLDPRGFVAGLNMYNAPTPDVVFQRTQELLGRARELHQQQAGRRPFSEAVHGALSEGMQNTLRAANPELLTQVRNVDPRAQGDTASASISRQLSGDAGIPEAELTATLAQLPESLRPYARELLAQQGEVFSPRRFAAELAEQHTRLMEVAALQGIAPDDVYFYIPRSGKSYGMIAMAHRQATGMPVGRYINGPDDLSARGLGRDKAVVVLDDVAGSGQSLDSAVGGIDFTGFPGRVLVSPMVSTEMARSLFNDPSSGVTAINPHVSYEPRAMSRALTESEFFRNLSPTQQARVEALIGYKGFMENALSMAFPYMAPDNNSAFFAAMIARYFIVNRTLEAAKNSSFYNPPTH